MKPLYTIILLYTFLGNVYSQSNNIYGNLEYELLRQFDPYNQLGQFNEELNEVSSTRVYKLSLVDSLYVVEQDLMGMTSIFKYIGNDSIQETVEFGPNEKMDNFLTPTPKTVEIDSSRITPNAMKILGVSTDLLELWTEHTYTKYYYSTDYSLEYSQFKHHEFKSLYDCSKITKALPLKCEYEYFAKTGNTKIIDRKYILEIKKLPHVD